MDVRLALQLKDYLFDFQNSVVVEQTNQMSAGGTLARSGGADPRKLGNLPEKQKAALRPL